MAQPPARSLYRGHVQPEKLQQAVCREHPVLRAPRLGQRQPAAGLRDELLLVHPAQAEEESGRSSSLAPIP